MRGHNHGDGGVDRKLPGVSRPVNSLSQEQLAGGLQEGVKTPAGRDFSPTVTFRIWNSFGIWNLGFPPKGVDLNQTGEAEISNDLDLHRQEHLNDVGIGQQV